MENNLDFLLQYLLEEGGHKDPVPTNLNEKFRLFRSLVNTRGSAPAGAEFLTLQDEFLQSLIAENGITDVDDLHPVRDNLYLWRGDITTLRADAIVNAANSSLLGCFKPCHPCIDNFIHTYAGIQLRLECAGIMEKQGCPEPTGQAKITEAYNLPCRYILHTVGPIVTGNLTDEHRKLLACCYRSCLSLAEEYKIKSVAFCCISTGEFQFPNEEAAEIAIDTVTTYLKNAVHLKKVIFNVLKETDEIIYKKLLRSD
jgi:O-acetyl-ADP-ribose deacetylase (regulator of RNase III)